MSCCRSWRKIRRRANAFYKAYAELQSTMQSRFRPDPETVKKQAGEAGRRLRQWKENGGTDAVASQLAGFLKKPRDDESIRTWDESVQLYLAAAAVLPPGEDSQAKKELWELRNELAFPSTYNSPIRFPKGTQSAENVRERLVEFLKHLP